MYSPYILTTLFLSAFSLVNARAVPRASTPASYNEGYLEPYSTYHARYLAVQCNSQHNTTFFDACCHPLLATESLENNRPPECNPANNPSSHPSGTPGPTVVPVKPTPAPPPPPSPSPPRHSPSPSPSPAPSPPPPPAPAPPPPPPPSPAPPNPTPPTPPPNNGGSSNTGGFATFYFQKGNAGACGKVNPDSAMIGAIDQDRYGNSGGPSSLCGQQVKITNNNNGKSVVITIADDCPTCVNGNSIDLSVGAFNQIATQDEGIVPITWEFI